MENGLLSPGIVCFTLNYFWSPFLIMQVYFGFSLVVSNLFLICVVCFLVPLVWLVFGIVGLPLLVFLLAARALASG